MSDEKTFNDVVIAVGLLAHGDREKMTPEQIREAGDGVIGAVRGLLAEREEARNWVRRLTAKERVLTCAFCGEAYPPGTPESNDGALLAHVKVCAKHPMREAETEIARLRQEIRDLRTYDRDL